MPRWLVLLLAGILVLALLWLIAWLTRMNTHNELRQQGSEDLELYAAALAHEIDQNKAMPQVLSEYPVFTELLSDSGSTALIDAANRQLETFNRLSGTLTTYLLDADGITIASSNWATEDSFIGEDLSFRPYYSVAMQEGNAAYFALGTTSGTRGYYFSSAIKQNNKPIGVMVIKLDLSTLEKSWEQGGDIVVVTDQDGVVFISSMPDWLYHALYPLTADALDRVHASRRYPNQQIAPLQIVERETVGDNEEHLLIASGDDAVSRSYIQLSRTMPEKAWTLHVLVGLEGVHAAVRNALLIGSLLILLGMAGLKIALNRKAARLQREQIEKEAYEQLESLVDLRTKELRTEINERKQVESDLRETRSNLVQASKMAALGQMATGINHELNQPLSAIRSFAENASTLLQRNDLEEVNSNLNLIVKLSERMGGIMKHLKLFARKAQPELSAVPIQATLNETLEVLEPAIRRNGVTVHSELPKQPYFVVAESNRLQQVFTNLIQNAIDAMHDRDTRELTLGIQQSADDQHLEVLVSDTGGGISPEIQTRLFEPFFTTKSADAGLGLGLSITAGIIKDFGGNIELRATGERGSTFRVTLQVATQLKANAA
ncbi:MAG: GHKL domain-containing protein [Gammaproteobacteria bacterium]|nr:GHKL domain-containing protein [Gammaproteobacteria bacterium]